MNPLDRVGAVLDALWSAIDPDEPVLCDCAGAFTCPDCSLGAPLDAAADWASPSPIAAA